MNDPILEHFLAACGSKEPLRLGVGQRGELLSEARTFRQPFVVVGRRPESDLLLDHWQVSRRHAYLQLIEGRFYCVDLGSRTGTHGGDATERSGWLERGRALQIGPFTVRPECPGSSLKPSGSMPGVTWELPGRAIGQSLWRMDRHLALVGRSAACKIRIVEADVSKFHCSVVLTARGVWVVDLLGQNGICVNERPTRYARLEDGDELRIGRHVLRPRYDSPPAPLPGSDARPGSSLVGPLATIEPGQLMPMGRPGSDFPARISPAMGQDLVAAFAQSGGTLDPSVNLLVHQFGMMQQQMFDQFHQTMMMMFEGFATLHREQASSIREEFENVRKLSDEIEALRRETARLADEAAKGPLRPKPPTNGHYPSMPTPPPDQALPRRPLVPSGNRMNSESADSGGDIHAQLLLRLSTMQNERQNRWQKILGMMSGQS